MDGDGSLRDLHYLRLSFAHDRHTLKLTIPGTKTSEQSTKFRRGASDGVARRRGVEDRIAADGVTCLRFIVHLGEQISDQTR